MNNKPIFTLPKRSTYGVLFLHGGGGSNAARYQYLQKQFSNVGIASMAFDFSPGSLNNRLSEAEAALKAFSLRSKIQVSKIYVWGSSMGGHVACRLTERHPDIKGIILQSAAAYSAASETLPMNEQFTRALSQPDSWLHSPAFDALENYFGQILVVYGENDSIIPEGVKTRYRQIAAAKSGQSFLLSGGLHTLLKPETEIAQSVLDQLTNLSSDFIRGS